jgi:RHS repeat-associated protein
MTMIVPVRNKIGTLPFKFDLVNNFGNMGTVSNYLQFQGTMDTGGFGFNSSVSHPTLSTCGTLGLPNYSTFNQPGTKFFFWDATGAKHYFTVPISIRGGPSCGSLGPVAVPADDGSGYTIVVTGSNSLYGISTILYNKDGLLYTGGLTDPDGNSMSGTSSSTYTVGATSYTTTNTIVDTLGQPALTETDNMLDQNGLLIPTRQTFSYADASGNTQSYVVNYASLAVATAFTCTSGGVSLDVSPTSMYLPTGISIPGGGEYVITYESTPGHSGYVTGRPAEITLPSGGYISFAYGNGAFGGTNSIAGYNCVAGTIPWLQVSINDNNGHTSTKTYQNNANSVYVVGYGSAWTNGPGNYTITETDSLGDVTTHYFWDELEEERVISDVNKGVLETTLTCYNSNFTNCSTAGYATDFVSQQFITQRDTYTYMGSAAPSLVETKNDAYGNTTQITRYDVGATFPPSGSPVSTTTITYDLNGACGTLTLPYIYDRPCSITTTNSAGTTVGQTNYTYNSAGHPIQTTSWISGSTYATTSAQYNSNGTVKNVTDANDHMTSYTYGDCNGALPSSITYPSANGVTPSTYEQWNCSGGVVANSTDVNGKTTTFSYADPLWRLTGTSYPDGGSTSTTYSTGSSFPWTVSTTTAINSSSELAQTAVYDGLSRVTQTQATSDTMGPDYVDKSYDLLGRVYTVSNPHRSGSNPTDGTTTYSYDALNRPTLVTKPGNAQTTISYVNISYVNNCTTVADENGNARKSCVDGLGRLTGVWEDPGTSSHLNYETDYVYNALDDLTSVIQKGGVSTGWRTRSFKYDGLSRLTNASNPESGAVSYSYDANGNVTSKTSPLVNAAAGSLATQTIGYCYDALNRLSAKLNTAPIPSICQAPTANLLLTSYSYDSSSISGAVNVTGHVTDEKSYVGGVVVAERRPFKYDNMGRIEGDWQCVLGNCGSAFTPSYTYDYAGNIATATPGAIAGQPGGSPIFSVTHDAVNRLASVTSSLPNSSSYPATLFSATTTSPIAYGPAGLQNALLGVNTSNETPTITLSRTYDQRMRVLSESDTASGVLTASATKSTGSIAVSGSEKQVTEPGTPGSATITVTGTEGGVTTCIKIWNSATHAYINECTTKYDTGSLSVVIDGFTATANYGQGSTDPLMATALATALNGSGSPVTASANSNVVTMTSVAVGAGSNYPFTVSNGTDFSGGSSGSLAGGANGPTYFDSGSISATVNGVTVSVPFGQTSTATGLASALAAALQQQAGGFLSATASGSTITLQSLAANGSVNWPISVSSSYESQYFSSGSFPVSGSNMSGGMNAGYQPETVYSYAIPSSGGYDGTGNLKSVNDAVIGNWAYSYDVLNRLQTASASSGPYGNHDGCWAYDGFGNRTAESYQTSACPSSESNVLANTTYNVANQVTGTSVNSATTGFTYDAAGNVLNDGANQYVYDMEGRLCAVASTIVRSMNQYVYDAEGLRIAKGTLSSWPPSGSICNAPTAGNGYSLTNSYVLGLGGEQFSEVNGSGSWIHTNIFADGKLLATYSGSDTYFALTDWLGTKRAEVTPDGYLSTTFSLPFGNNLSTGGNATDATEYHFTGKERDTESGLDYFGARYMGSSMGRFMSPDFTGDGSDPFPVPSADFENPQSLNLYSYVHNNPLVNVDPDGHDCVVQSRTSSTSESVSVSTGNCDNVQVGDGQTKTYVAGTVTGVQAGADGHSIDIGYTPYGANGDTSSSVTNAGAAPIPNNTNLAYNWGNNAQGYQQLGNASQFVTDATIGYSLAFGSVGAAIAGGEIAAGTAAARSGIIFRLAHGMRLAAGHSQVLAETGAIKNAIAAAIASGAIQKMGGSAFQGVVNVSGTFIRFTGAFTPNGVVVSNVMGQALQK